MHTHLWAFTPSVPAQNKLHIPLRKIPQHLPFRRSECRYMKPKCSSNTCQVYLAEARPWSLQSVKRLLVTEWSVVVLWGAGVVSSALETNTDEVRWSDAWFSIWTGGVSLKQMLFVGCHCMFGVGQGAKLCFQALMLWIKTYAANAGH